MNIDETMLDQLHALQTKRAAEILENGRPYQLTCTEKTCESACNIDPLSGVIGVQN